MRPSSLKEHILLQVGAGLGASILLIIYYVLTPDERGQGNPLILTFIPILWIATLLPVLIVEALRQHFQMFAIAWWGLLCIGASYVPFVVTLRFLLYGASLQELSPLLWVTAIIFNPMFTYLALWKMRAV